MFRLAYIPLLLVGWTNLIDKSTQVAQPTATLFSKPLRPSSLAASYTTFRVPNILRYTHGPERAFYPFYAEADPNDEPNDSKVISIYVLAYILGYYFVSNSIEKSYPFNIYSIVCL